MISGFCYNKTDFYKQTSKEIKNFLNSMILKQQAMYSLLYLNRSCIDYIVYIDRNAPLINLKNLYPQIHINDFDEGKFNKELYDMIFTSFKNNLRKIFEKLTEMKKDQYSKFIHNEIIIVKQIIKFWKNANITDKSNETDKHIEENGEDRQIKRGYTIPSIEIISEIIKGSPFLFLYQKIYCIINDFLKSLKYNQQAQYSLLYLIQAIDKYLSQAGLSINIDISYSYSIILYEEYYNENLYNTNLQLFLDNLAKIYHQIINNPKIDHLNSILTLNSSIEIEIKKVSNIVKYWNYFHIIYPNWNVKQLYD
ncbi:hypothetical protein M9Y10_044455 [Tritrichomonas musculus]|uniref:Uncharacterized protein n=1 Tax=Tritrichomonas musculus TaxID=1915356 RepID=A0ABR2JSE0_9EUKA